MSMTARRIHRFYYCLRIQVHTRLRLSPFTSSHARYLACLQKSFPFANWALNSANRTLIFANERMGRNIKDERKIHGTSSTVLPILPSSRLPAHPPVQPSIRGIGSVHALHLSHYIFNHARDRKSVV